MFDRLSNVWVHVASFGREQRGAIAVIVALLLPILAGVLALAIDLSRAANLQTELQDHADAAALAGATQLDQSDGSRARAIQAAAGALALALNTQRFADDTEHAGEGGIVVDDTVNVPADGVAVNNDIKFFVDLADKVEAT
ncbi:MAG TPA: pilus assembly protein TadG-related protein, partial [Kiloniellaceae bacterium]|nr:pilus assembly protein TadG-related protein [Kiloniellaceae bacterium]